MLASIRDLLRGGEMVRRASFVDGFAPRFVYESLRGAFGRYEGLTPMGVYLWEHVEYADEESGDVESPVGWFARIGKWILETDSHGFCYAYKCQSETAARVTFGELDAAYGDWAADDDC